MRKVVAATVAFLLVFPPTASAEPVGTTIAIATLATSALGSLFGGKVASANARARAQQFEAMMKQIAALDEKINVNQILISELLKEVGGLTEEGERARLLNDARGMTEVLFRNVASLEESGFDLLALEEHGIASDTNTAIQTLSTANSFYEQRLRTGGDLTLLPYYTANLDALLTAYHLRSLLARTSTGARAIVEAGYALDRDAICEANNDAWDEILSVEGAPADCGDITYADVIAPFTRSLMIGVVRDATELLNDIIDRNVDPQASFADQNLFLQSSCNNGAVVLRDDATGRQARIAAYNLPGYAWIRNAVDLPRVNQITMDVSVVETIYIPSQSHTGSISTHLDYGDLRLIWSGGDNGGVDPSQAGLEFQRNFEIGDNRRVYGIEVGHIDIPGFECIDVGDTASISSVNAAIWTNIAPRELGLSDDELIDLAYGRDLSTQRREEIGRAAWHAVLRPDGDGVVSENLRVQMTEGDGGWRYMPDRTAAARLLLRENGIAAVIVARDRTLDRARELGLLVEEDIE